MMVMMMMTMVTTKKKIMRNYTSPPANLHSLPLLAGLTTWKGQGPDIVYDHHNDDDDQNNDDDKDDDDDDNDDLGQDANDRSFSSVDARQNKSKTCEDYRNHVSFL